jgi:hypothetical protein
MSGGDARETTKLTRAQIAALRRWPKVLALTLTHAGNPTVTWAQFCEAQDQFEAVLCRSRSLTAPLPGVPQ